MDDFPFVDDELFGKVVFRPDHRRPWITHVPLADSRQFPTLNHKQTESLMLQQTTHSLEGAAGGTVAALRNAPLTPFSGRIRS